MAPMPRVRIEIGTRITDSAGQMIAFNTPMSRPASSASLALSIEKPGRTQARNQSTTAVQIAVTKPRHNKLASDGRSAA